MRALCGAIVTAGGLIGLGLTAVGYGLRFQAFGPTVVNPNSQQIYGSPTLVLILVVLIISTIIGTGIAFLGLAFHHERRFYELDRERGGPVPRNTGPIVAPGHAPSM